MKRGRNERRRVTSDNANRRLPVLNTIGKNSTLRRVPSDNWRSFPTSASVWSQVQDYRSLASKMSSFPRTVQGTPARVVKKAIYQTTRDMPVFREVFHAPRETLVCLRRQMRKEVLHALGMSGKGGQRSPKFNWRSKISCKKK